MPILHQRPTTALNGLQLKADLMKAFEGLINSLYKNHLIYPGFQGTITLDSQVMMSQPPTHHGERGLVIEMSDEVGEEITKSGNEVVITEPQRVQAHVGGGVASVTQLSQEPNMNNPLPQSRAVTGNDIPMSLSGQPMSAGRHDPNKRARSLDQKMISLPHDQRGGEVQDEISKGILDDTRPSS